MKLLTSLLALLLLLLIGCATKAVPLEGNYELTELVDYDSPANAKVTMTVTPERVAGKGPINNWNGPIQDGKIGMMIGTRMAGPPELMDMEMKLYEVFKNAELRMDGDTLTLINSDETVATFERID